MKVQQAFSGARGVDSLSFSQAGTLAQAHILKASGVDYFVGYLGEMTPARLGIVLAAGLAFMPVTRANRFDGAQAVLECQRLGLPKGCTVWLDLEGREIEDEDWTTASANDRERLASRLIEIINDWARAVAGAGHLPAIYVGSPQPLTADELWKLAVVRYWKAYTRVYDRFGRTHDEPTKAGWCQLQLSHGEKLGQLWPPGNVPNKTLVDVNAIQVDRLGRLPTWIVT